VNILSDLFQVITGVKAGTKVGRNLLLNTAYYPSSPENSLEDASPKHFEPNSIISNLFFSNLPKKTKGEFEEPFLLSTFKHKTSRI
jgi:hypothetical protein